MAQILEVKTVVETKSAEKNVEGLTGKVKGGTAATSEMSGSLDKMSGGAVSAFKSVVAGVKSGVMAMKTLRGAIIATGIGALVVVVASLTAAFQGSEEGQNKFAKITGVVGAIVGNLVDVLADLGDKLISVFENPKQTVIDIGNAIKENLTNRVEGVLELLPALGKAIKLAMNLEFSEAAKVAANASGKIILGVENIVEKVDKATESVKNFVKENIKEGEAAGRVADMRAKADKIERGLLLRRAKAEREIAELRLKAKDIANVSSEERKKALEGVLVLQDSLIGSEQEVANLRRDAQTAENGFARSTKENLLEEERLKAEAVSVETRRINQKRQIARELSSTEIEIASNTAAKKAEQLAKEDADRLDKIKAVDNEIREYKLANDEVKLEDLLVFEEKKRILELEKLDLTEADKAAIKLKYREKESAAITEATGATDATDKKSKDDAKKREDVLASARENTIAGGLALMAASSKKGSKMAKAAAVAQVTFDTIRGVQAAFAQTTDITPTQSLRFLNAGIAASFGALSIKKILSTPEGGGGGGSVSIPSAGGGARPSTETPRIPNFESNNGGVGGRNSFGSMRAVVVQQDIKDSAGLDNRVDDLIKIGK